MSSHYIVKEDEMLRKLSQFNLNYKLTDATVQVEWCPFCKKPHNYHASNAYTLGLQRSSGAFNCFRCGIKGSWWDFKNLLYGTTSLHDFENSSIAKQTFESTLNDGEYYLYHRQLIEDRDNYKEELELITGKSKQTQRHINFAILEKYKIGIGKETFSTPSGKQVLVPVLYFPMFDTVEPEEESTTSSNNEDEECIKAFSLENEEEVKKRSKDSVRISTDYAQLVKYKIRGIGKNNKQYMRMAPSGVKNGIFGLNTVPIGAREIVITEGEYDAMAVHQATGLPAVSLPNGASSLPLETLNCFERFTKIYLWLDNDKAGASSCQKLAEKLGLNRTYIVRTDKEKDANDILRSDPAKIQRYINQSCTIPDQNILSFENLSDRVLNRLRRVQEDKGVQSRRFEFFNNTIAGLRKGELTILTGPTGSGKTSFLSNISVDFCEQGVPTIWGSFEIKNEILASNMLMQMSGKDFSRSQVGYEYWGEHFESLPMYFMNFFGSTSLESVIHTIEYAIYKYDIQHVIIDNLQFLLGTQAKGFDKFDLQDRAIESFRQLATTKDIHLTLVIHPKKVDENEDLHISSVFGSAKATQEADNVIILQRREHYRVFDVKKNRYSGEIGSKGIIFDKTNKNFYELSLFEVKEIINKKTQPSVFVQEKREILVKKITDEHSTIVRKPRKIKLEAVKTNGGNGGDEGGSAPPIPSGGVSGSGTPQKSSSPPSQPTANSEQSSQQKTSTSIASSPLLQPAVNDEYHNNLPTKNRKLSETRLNYEEEDFQEGIIEPELEAELTGKTRKASKAEIEQWEGDTFEPTDFDGILSERRFIPPSNIQNSHQKNEYYQQQRQRESARDNYDGGDSISEMIMNEQMQNLRKISSNRQSAAAGNTTQQQQKQQGNKNLDRNAQHEQQLSEELLRERFNELKKKKE